MDEKGTFTSYKGYTLDQEIGVRIIDDNDLTPMCDVEWHRAKIVEIRPDAKQTLLPKDHADRFEFLVRMILDEDNRLDVIPCDSHGEEWWVGTDTMREHVYVIEEIPV